MMIAPPGHIGEKEGEAAGHFSMRLLVVWAFVIIMSMTAKAEPPRLYAEPAYQSPVRAQADDLLLLAGYGFDSGDQVYYQAQTRIYGSLRPPKSLPGTNSADLGQVEVISIANLPYSLTLKLPAELREGQTYALWVRNRSGEWSNGVLVNDARPLWLSPATVHSSVATASLPRELKIIGRNLQPAPGSVTQVRLTGPKALTLSARGDTYSSVMNRYVASVGLPAMLPAGLYRVSVSRDGLNWVESSDRLKVSPDPQPNRSFWISDPAYGACRADDDRDDSACIVRAIGAAQVAGGGDVILGPGTWNVSMAAAAAASSSEGIVVPAGVNLKGIGAAVVQLQGEPLAGPLRYFAFFTLEGSNTIEDLQFRDQATYTPEHDGPPVLRLGHRTAEPAEPDMVKSIEDVAIVRDKFDRVYTAISDGGSPIRRLYVANNVFGAYSSAIELAGNCFNVAFRFRVDDSVIAYNLFKPGSRMDANHGVGVLATEIGASRHLDFSHNTADGAAVDALYSPDDAHGWRAAFFFHMNDSHEMTLVSQNTATCTGDKDGDGEAIAFDNNGNTFGFDRAKTVSEASTDSVTVEGPLTSTQFNRSVPADRYYLGHWIQVVQGRGLGQVRRITSYERSKDGATVRFTVSPSWDVVPRAGDSRITSGREFWQLYALANTVDHRKPLCQKSNRTNNKGGVIAMWAQSSDSVIEGNRQYDTDGILFFQSYNAANAGWADGTAWSFDQSFLQVRDNLVDGEYDWDSNCSSSGIQGFVSAAPTPFSVPPVTSFGLDISHNTVRRADGELGGAIAFPRTWFQGPGPHDWTMIDNALIHHNRIVDIDGELSRRSCMGIPTPRRIGINLGESNLVKRSVLYSNRCQSVSVAINSRPEDATILCPPSADRSFCECREDRAERSSMPTR